MYTIQSREGKGRFFKIRFYWLRSRCTHSSHIFHNIGHTLDNLSQQNYHKNDPYTDSLEDLFYLRHRLNNSNYLLSMLNIFSYITSIRPDKLHKTHLGINSPYLFYLVGRLCNFFNYPNNSSNLLNIINIIFVDLQNSLIYNHNTVINSFRRVSYKQDNCQLNLYRFDIWDYILHYSL